MAQEKKEALIRGDKLLLALQFLENAYANHLATLCDEWDGRVGDTYAQEVLKVEIAHRFGSAHWYGQIALRAPTRATLVRTLDEASRFKSSFRINAVVSRAISTASNRGVVNGLSRSDRRKLRDHLARFLCLVACGEIDEQSLRNI